LQPGHIEQILNVDSHVWYKNRVRQHRDGVPQPAEAPKVEVEDEPTSQRVLRARNNDEKAAPQAATDVPPIKIQL
jgi:cell division protein FtsN